MSSYVDNTSDSDDDVPISVLLAREKKKNGGVKAKPKVTKVSKAKETKKSPAPKVKSSSSSRSISKPAPKVKSSSSGNNKVGEFYGTEKGKLAQRFLVRWWYAMSWPNLKSIGSPPAGYETLDGFPGVFVGTSTDNLGNIVDKRDKKSAPTLKNMAKKTSQELKDLCEKALEEQIRQLQGVEGNNTDLETNLRKELREVKAVNVNKADKAAMGLTF